MVNGSFRGPKERRSFKPKVAGSTPVGRIPVQATYLALRVLGKAQHHGDSGRNFRDPNWISLFMVSLGLNGQAILIFTFKEIHRFAKAVGCYEAMVRVFTTAA